MDTAWTHRLDRGRPRVALPLAVAGLGALLGLATATAFGHRAPSLLTAVGAVGLIALLALVVVSTTAAVALAVFLLGFVIVEPAPADGILLVLLLVAAVTGSLRLRRAPAVVIALVGAFLAINLFTTAFAVDLRRAILFSATTYYLVLFGVWLACWVDGRRRARLLAKAYVLSATLSALLGVAAYLAPIPGRSILTAFDGSRATGFFQDPNVFGSYLVPAALIVLSELLEPRLFRLRKLTALGCFLLLDVGVVLSFSRAAWGNLVLGIAVMVGVIGLRRGGIRKASAVVAVVVVSAAGGAAMLAAIGSLSFLQQRAHVQAYDTARFSAQETGIRLVSRHPLGIGPGQFERNAPLSAHSTYIRSVAELGVLGLALLSALLLATLVLAGRNTVAGIDTYGIGSAPLLGAWCGLLLSGFVIDTLHWRHLWFVAALVWAGAARRR